MAHDPRISSATVCNAPDGERAGEPDDNGRTRLVHWFRCWRKPIRHWIGANKAVSSAEVDDLVQEVFMRLMRYSDDVVVKDPQAYLFRIAANVVHEWRTRCRVRMQHDDVWLDDLTGESTDEPHNDFARAKASQCVLAALERLPARQREILLMHVHEDMTYKQIAERRGLTYRIVLRDLTRAYATLRMQLPSPDELAAE